MEYAADIVELIDAAVEEDREDEFRNHLGGSQIGKPCLREGWYIFRWAKKSKHSGRMLRLFERGHKEEFRFVSYLRRVGVDVREYSERLVYSTFMDIEMGPGQAYGTLSHGAQVPSGFTEVTDQPFHVAEAKRHGIELKQWRVLDVGGHFGGSLDGLANADFEVLDRWGGRIPAGEEFLTEFKTHNTKSFCALVAEKTLKPMECGVKNAKPVHWFQMQVYMHKRGLRFALYMAVNKNDDDLYAEVVEYDPSIGPMLLQKAGTIIGAPKPLPRISNSPAWFECKFCDFNKICHYGEPMERNCRTCVNSVPLVEGQWGCNLWQSFIPSDAQRVGCDSWRMITD